MHIYKIASFSYTFDVRSKRGWSSINNSGIGKNIIIMLRLYKYLSLITIIIRIKRGRGGREVFML